MLIRLARDMKRAMRRVISKHNRIRRRLDDVKMFSGNLPDGFTEAESRDCFRR